MAPSKILIIGLFGAFLACCGTGLAGATPPVGFAPEIPSDAGRFKGWTVGEFKIVGVDKSLRETLSKGLMLSGENKLLGTDRALFFVSTLEDDLLRTQLFLARHGMPDAHIDVALLPKEGRNELAVRLTISGERVLISESRIEGLNPAETRQAEPYLPKPGTVFEDAAVDRLARDVVEELQKAGHAWATVESTIETGEPYTVGVRFVATPGPVCYFRNVTVIGAPQNLDGLAHRTVDIRHGARFHPRTLRRADENLRLLGVFGQIRVDIEKATEDSIDVLVAVSERPPRLVEFGVGYWTDDKLRVSGRWQHRNLFQGGRGFEVSGLYSQYEQRVATSTWWPAIPVPRSRLQLEAAIARSSEANYTQIDVSLEFSSLYRLTSLSFVQLGINVSRVNVTPTAEAEGEIPDEQGLVTTIFSRLDIDGTDDRIRPRKGPASKTRLEFAPEPLGVSAYVLAEEKLVVYVPLPLGSFVSFRTRLGGAHPIPGEGDLLPNRRFYSGGATSHRGFGRRKLGPLDESGEALGGNLVYEGSVDLRFPLLGMLKGAVFIDTGQVWSRAEDFKPKQIEVAVGPGLWIDTPVGPFRVDYAVRLTTLSPEPKNQFQISIGTTF